MQMTTLLFTACKSIWLSMYRFSSYIGYYRCCWDELLRNSLKNISTCTVSMSSSTFSGNYMPREGDLRNAVLLVCPASGFVMTLYSTIIDHAFVKNMGYFCLSCFLY